MYKLDDLETEKVMAFCQDEKMFQAVKKVLLANIYSNGVMKEGEAHEPLVNGALVLPMAILRGEIGMDNEQLGAHTLAFAKAVNEIEKGFGQLKTIKKETKVVENNQNEAI